MPAELDRWEAAVTGFWERLDAFRGDEGVRAMQELAAACPANDGRGAFELASAYDAMGFEAEAGAEHERALELGLDEARHAQLAVQYGWRSQPVNAPPVTLSVR